ncbi:unnamed protein product [Protopolystoma xenopodis]|uniref:Uncharacterized protein n=1 Tax=Protopolystoma xenopodis TaxID=117903 RepID=A0A448XI02_9PLAT|nr:unnamed protein product [Protopolystoma xenopodis]
MIGLMNTSMPPRPDIVYRRPPGHSNRRHGRHIRCSALRFSEQESSVEATKQALNNSTIGESRFLERQGNLLEARCRQISSRTSQDAGVVRKDLEGEGISVGGIVEKICEREEARREEEEECERGFEDDEEYYDDEEAYRIGRDDNGDELSDTEDENEEDKESTFFSQQVPIDQTNISAGGHLLKTIARISETVQNLEQLAQKMQTVRYSGRTSDIGLFSALSLLTAADILETARPMSNDITSGRLIGQTRADSTGQLEPSPSTPDDVPSAGAGSVSEAITGTPVVSCRTLALVDRPEAARWIYRNRERTRSALECLLACSLLRS